MPPDSSVRIPDELLERASGLDPENRSNVVREGLARGLTQMENERLLEQASNVEGLVRHLLLTDSLVAEQLGLLVTDRRADEQPDRLGLLPFLRIDQIHGDLDSGAPEYTMPVFKIGPKDGVVELVVPPSTWMDYEPVDLQIHVSNPEANVRVSKLCSDEGSGRDLLMPGWHGLDAFGPPATVLAKVERVKSPTDLRLTVRADKVSYVSVVLLVKVVCDWAQGMSGAYGASDSPLPLGGALGALIRPPSVPHGPSLKGRLIRVPFERTNEITSAPVSMNPGQPFQSKTVNWGRLRLVRPVFKESRDLLYTVFGAFRIGGSPNLNCFPGWNCAKDYTASAPAYLRSFPVLLSPNVAYIDLKSVVEGKDPVVPYLLCEVMRDDALLG